MITTIASEQRVFYSLFGSFKILIFYLFFLFVFLFAFRQCQCAIQGAKGGSKLKTEVRVHNVNCVCVVKRWPQKPNAKAINFPR